MAIWVVVKTMIPFWVLNYNTAPKGYPKRDHKFDNHPHRGNTVDAECFAPSSTRKERNMVQDFFHQRRLGLYMGGCQNYGPFMDPYWYMAPNI